LGKDQDLIIPDWWIMENMMVRRDCKIEFDEPPKVAAAEATDSQSNGTNPLCLAMTNLFN
jgi:hypothetical protein